MELVDDETLFNPTPEEIGKKVLWAINNQYDVLIEKSIIGHFQLNLRAIRRNFL